MAKKARCVTHTVISRIRAKFSEEGKSRRYRDVRHRLYRRALEVREDKS